MDKTAYRISIEEDPTAGREAIRSGLKAFNEAHIGSYAYTPVCVCVRNETGTVIGGASGGVFFDWLVLETLWVSDQHRGCGIGTRILNSFEEEGTRQGAKRCMLDTMAFQAEPFYLKRGYREFGRIPNFIAGFDRIYFCKDLGKTDSLIPHH